MRFDSFEQMLAHLAETGPDAPALRYDDKTLSFSELKHAVDARAAMLRAEGKTSLGLLCDGSLDSVIELFAANLAGLQLVMLDASLDTDTLRTLIRYTDVDTLWGEERGGEDPLLHLRHDGTGQGRCPHRSQPVSKRLERFGKAPPDAG